MKQTSSNDKRVTFEEKEPRLHLFEEDQEVTAEERWFNQDDYIVFKATSREEARAWRRQGYSILLQETFLSPSPNAQQFIVAFAKLEGPLSKRGLERHLSRQHGEERSDHKDRARFLVLNHQEKLKSQGFKGSELEECLATLYREECRCARLFARRIGRADEIVVLDGEDNSMADNLLDFLRAGAGKGKMERRLSNYSAKSANSFDSTRAYNPSMHRRIRKSRDPSSPASVAAEEFYAGIA